MRRFLRRQDTHSLFIAGAAGLLLASLVIDLLLGVGTYAPNTVAPLALLCIGFMAFALTMGKRFPRAAGLTAIILFTLATVFFLSPEGDVFSAIASLQELPMLALYLGWFMRPAIGRPFAGVTVVLILLAMGFNPLFWFDGEIGVATAVQAIIIFVFCFEVGSMLWRVSEQRIIIDPLTGALNRRGFLQRLERELASAARTRSALCLVVIDFDGFKALNDSQGHSAGDHALAATVAHWRKGLRIADVIGRTGGDEFAIILPRTDAVAAKRTMVRLRETSEYSWSWGIAQAGSGDSAERLFERGDELLYRRKRLNAMRAGDQHDDAQKR